MIHHGMTYYTGICYKYIFERELYVFANMLEVLHMFDLGKLELSSFIRKYLNCTKCINFSSHKEHFNLGNVTLIAYNIFNDVNLYGSNLRGARLSSVFMNDADLSYADLMGADLEWANLNNSKLHNANLSGANLTGTKLQGADFLEADLRGANLVGADLKNANLNKALLENSIWRREDIEKAAMQIKENDFEYIYIYGPNGQEKTHKRELFPE